MFEEPVKVAALMRGFAPDWFVAGGWAVDLFLGRETRPHQDIEIAIFRRDQLALQHHLRGWVLKKAGGGALAEWGEGEFLRPPVHEIHCLNENGAPRRLEVLLNETDGIDWIFRRNEAVRKPLSKLHSAAAIAGVKFLSPAVVLLYKSKNPRARDEADFEAVKGRLGLEERRWLREALSVCYDGHHWLQSL